MTCSVYVDFDGTIAPADPTDTLLEQFADPSWKIIEAEWQAGKLTSWDTMQRQVQLLAVEPDVLDAYAATVTIDPDFAHFVEVCHRFDAHVMVVSDGFDRIISRALANAGLDLPFAANQLDHVGEGRWRLKFPHRRFDCAVRMGNCKCSHQNGAGAGRTVMVGDGRSDFCIAERSDFVIAKAKLADHCREKGLDHVRMTNFADAVPAMAEWLAQATRERRVGVRRRRVAAE